MAKNERYGHNIFYYTISLSLSNCRVNETNTTGQTPLHYAALWNDLKAVRLLLKNGADVELQDKDGVQPIFNAADHGNNEYVDVPRNIPWTRFCHNYHYTNLTFVGNLRFKTRSYIGSHSFEVINSSISV